MAEGEEMDVEAVLEKLGEALRRQYRSAVQYTITSGSLFGFEYQSFGDVMWRWAQEDLADARLLVEKLTALGGQPTTEMAELHWTGDPSEAVDRIVEQEQELVDILKEAITPTGQEGRSEALEHLLEHVILRKQDKIDFLMRARRTP